MAVKKTQIYSTLWEACDKLRGSMDASQYKDYVLILLFVKYLTDRAKRDSSMTIKIPKGSSFDDLVKLKRTSNIGEDITVAITNLVEENKDFLGDIQVPDFNDPTKFGKQKEMTKTLSKLIGVFENDNLDFSKNRAGGDDILGDAYEFLMKNFAAQSGKSKGQFYTPAEVSRTMAKILGLNQFESASTTIYDPTCGSGSLLLRAVAETKAGEASIRGQEKDNATASLAVLNMFLHGIENADIRQGNTITNPQFKIGGELETFDICIANPPFSQEFEGNKKDEFSRWEEENCPPDKNADYAFLLHLIKSMKPKTGRGACILPHGVLFRGNVEGEIRKKLLTPKCLIEGIIGLPSNVFYGTGIAACILIINKKDAETRNGIFMIDASKGFKKEGDKNKLREQDIRKIVDTWYAWKDVPHYARFVPLTEIGNKKNDYNLNISRYISVIDDEIHQDIDAHLRGGLPAFDIDTQMEEYWKTLPSLKKELFRTSSIEKTRYELIPEIKDINSLVFNNKDFKIQIEAFNKNRENWYKTIRPTLDKIIIDCKPKEIINYLGDEVLKEFSHSSALVDSYGVYDVLMNYWNDEMQDDCFLVSADGWKAELKIKPKKSTKKNDDDEDDEEAESSEDTKKKKTPKAPTKVDGYECDLLPVEVVLRKYYAPEVEEISKKENEIAEIQAELDSLVEENEKDFDDSLFPSPINKKTGKPKAPKFNQDNLKKKLTRITKGEETATKEQIELWQKYLDKTVKKGKISRVVTQKNKELLEKVQDKYKSFTSEEIQKLVIEDKWFVSLAEEMSSEMKKVAQKIVSDVTALENRYCKTLSEIQKSNALMNETVEEHLRELGFNW